MNSGAEAELQKFADDLQGITPDGMLSITLIHRGADGILVASGYESEDDVEDDLLKGVTSFLEQKGSTVRIMHIGSAELN